MTSMADHLLSQQYSRLGKLDASLLSEPHVTDEDAARLLEAYERKDISEAEYLALVTETRPFTPPPTNHSVIIDSGNYCSTVALPIVFKSFIQDHANPVVEETLSRHEVVMVEKISSGVLVHVRTSEAEKKLVGQEVMLLGRKFTIKRQSPFLNKFFLDIFGIRSTAIANELFMSFAALGTRPLFLTPRDVNMDAQVATTTWRFYFGEEQPPSCLVVRGFVTNQLVYGRKFYLARGRRSLAPPQRAGGFKRSLYAVELPFGPIYGATESANSCSIPRLQHHPVTKPASPSARQARQLAKQCSPPKTCRCDDPKAGKSNADAVIKFTAEESAQESSGSSMEEQMDTDMISASSDEDVDMARQMESGFKRNERSFADKNPFEALEMADCEFEAFEPEVPSDMTPGILMVPKLTAKNAVNAAQEPLPTKRRSVNLNESATSALVPDETILVSTEEAHLETQPDRVDQNMQHLDHVKAMLSNSKNMDKVIDSMRTFPTAWSTVLCSDLAGKETKINEMSEIHLLNRILAANMGTDVKMSFHNRAMESHLPLGKTRQSYVKFLDSAVAGRSDQVKNQWEILRLLSSFELLLMSACPYIFESGEWLKFLVGTAETGISPAHAQLLSDVALLRLLRSSLGLQLMTKLCQLAPTSVLLENIDALRESGLLPEELPTVSLVSLSPDVRANTEN